MAGHLSNSHSALDSIRLDQAGYYMPYQTTSIQAMETTMQAKQTLAGGVGYGAPQRPIPSRKKTKKTKKRKKFTLCGCGSNIDMYDDGLNTSFVAGEKIIGKIGGTFVQTSPPPMPTVEYCPSLAIEADRRKRSKMSELDSYSGSLQAALPRPKVERQLASRSMTTLSQRETLQSSPSSVDTRTPVMIAARDNFSDINSLQRDISQTVSLGSIARSIPDRRPPSNATQDGFHPAPRPKSSFALVCDSVPEQNDAEPPKQRQKRRGGFIGCSSSSIPIIDVEEASYIGHNSEAQDAKIPSRSSVASTMSKYSVMSPYIEYTSTPSRATMGGKSGTPANVKNRSSLASTSRTFSIGTSPSLQESDQSPAIGDVLSHFPGLSDMAHRDDHVFSHYSSEVNGDGDDDDDNISQPKRINTFGLDRRRNYEYKEDYSADLINSYHYDDIAASSYDTSPASSTGSIQTDSSGLSRRSQKRAAVMCSLPSHQDLAALSRCSEVGDLTWEEKLLILSRGHSSSSDAEEMYSSGTPADDTIQAIGDWTITQRVSKETIRSTMTSHKRGRGSSTSQAPFSPPPNLPLPPVPSLTKHKSGHPIRSPNSLASFPRHQHSSLQHCSTLPRSTTCPDLSGGGYAY